MGKVKPAAITDLRKGDIGVGVMAWLNVVAIILLRKPALKALKDYQEQRREGKDPVFDPVALGIKNTDQWTSGSSL
jgi:alanine or glycine:cation symporter, AGCS family